MTQDNWCKHDKDCVAKLHAASEAEEADVLEALRSQPTADDADEVSGAARGGRRVWIYSSRVPDRNASTPPCSLAVSSSLCTRNAAADKTPLPLPVFPRAAAKLSRLFGRVCAGEDG